jgi:hypothetical protein
MTENQIDAAAWVKPTFEIMSVNVECTAYAAALDSAESITDFPYDRLLAPAVLA